MEKTEEKTLGISVLGDSVSTFAGYTPEEAVFYETFMKKYSGVTDVGDTWWMQVIRAMGGTLLVNDSYAGSLISGGAATAAASARRIRALGAQGDPDVILVAMGANDWGFRVLPQEFEAACRRLLYCLKQSYPDAVIYMATLLRGKEPEDGPMFFDVDGCVSQEVYSQIIRKCVDEAEVRLVDVARCGEEYESVDGVHPNKNGMRTIAELWIREIL